MDKLDPDNVPKWLANDWQSLYTKDIIAGINDDDCAVLRTPDGFIAVTTDFLNSSPIAKELGIAKNFDLGRLVVAANLSDLCGSGAEPLAMLIAIVMERGSSTEDFKDIMEGVKFELTKYGVPLVGGDTKLGKAQAILGIAIGTAKASNSLFLKNAAKADDRIWVSGPIGGTSAAVDGLCNFQMPEAWKAWAKSTLVEPNLPLHMSRELAKMGIAHGGTDLSDGLGADLENMCISSGVGAIIDTLKIPILKEVGSVAQLRGIPAWSYALTIGGDFQFIVTSPPEHSDRLRDLGYIDIGVITTDKNVILSLSNGGQKPMPAYGHRDGRNMSFAQEVDHILNNVKKSLYD